MNVLLSILPLFIIMGLGAFAKLTKLADDSWITVLNKYAYFIGMPALIFNSMISVEIEFGIFWYNAGMILSGIIVLFLILKILKIKSEILNTYLLCFSFGNIAYLGFPFITSIIPNAGAQVSLVIASTSIILFGVLVAYLEYSKHAKISAKLVTNIVTNPLLLAVLFGILSSLTKLNLPSFTKNTLTMVAGSASPVALFALGMFLVQKIKFDKEMTHSIIITTLKLFILPLFFYLISKESVVTVLEAAMPVAVSVFAMSEQYPLNKKVVVYAIVISTLVSAITLPILSSILVQ